MSDTRLRALERRWKQTGSTEDEAAHLRERLRLGRLEEWRIWIAAETGHKASCLVAQLPLGRRVQFNELFDLMTLHAPPRTTIVWLHCALSTFVHAETSRLTIMQGTLPGGSAAHRAANYTVLSQTLAHIGAWLNGEAELDHDVNPTSGVQPFASRIEDKIALAFHHLAIGSQYGPLGTNPAALGAWLETQCNADRRFAVHGSVYWPGMHAGIARELLKLVPALLEEEE